MANANSENSLTNWTYLLILALIWGSSFILIKRGLVIFSPGELGAYRIVAAATFLLPLSLPKVKKLTSIQIQNLILVGLVGSFIPAFLFAKAQTQLSSSLTGVLNALTPLFVVLVGWIFFGSKITRQNAFGLAIAFLGVSVLVLVKDGVNIGSLQGFNAYALFVILACTCYGFNLNLIKYRFVELKPVEITAISLLMVLPLALIYLMAGTQFAYKLANVPGALQAFGYVSLLGILGTALALILFNMLVKTASPIFASSVTYLIPIVAILWGVWDGEVLLWSHYLGFAAVIFGVWVGNRKKPTIKS